MCIVQCQRNVRDSLENILMADEGLKHNMLATLEVLFPVRYADSIFVQLNTT